MHPQWRRPSNRRVCFLCRRRCRRCCWSLTNNVFDFLVGTPRSITHTHTRHIFVAPVRLTGKRSTQIHNQHNQIKLIYSLDANENERKKRQRISIDHINTWKSFSESKSEWRAGPNRPKWWNTKRNRKNIYFFVAKKKSLTTVHRWNCSAKMGTV